MAALKTLALCVAGAGFAAAKELLGSHAAFPLVPPSAYGGNTFTYMSVKSPEALNLDGARHWFGALAGMRPIFITSPALAAGSRYGIAVCLSASSKASWTFSTDGGGWCCECAWAGACRVRFPHILPCFSPQTTRSSATSAR